MGLEYSRNSNIRTKIQAEIEAKNYNETKDKLKKSVAQKIRTTMIGALSAVEKNLGFLWEDDTEMKEIYNKLRSNILDLGNNQIRNIEEEISQYDVKFNKYHLDLPIRGRINHEQKDNRI